MNVLKTICFYLLLICTSFSSLYSQNITVIGIGKLGLCFALCLEQAGHHVLGVDLSRSYIDSLNNKTYCSKEPYVTEYLNASRNFRATTSLEEGLAFSDICFLIVPTNHLQNSAPYDPIALDTVFKELNDRSVSNKHLIVTSTVPPGYLRNQAIPALNQCKNVTLSYNPEFIAQGQIIEGLQKPDLVLIGEANEEVGSLIEQIYRSFCKNDPPIERMSVESAEIAKMALNCFVTAKVTFANLIGDVADETPGADKFAILQAIGKDSRIGLKYFKPGYGYGGPCFPRDNRALAAYADSLGVNSLSLQATDQINRWHAEFMAKKELARDLDEYCFEDVCFKSSCPLPIIEESQKLAVAKKIAEAGKRVKIIDSKEVLEKVYEQFGDLFIYQEKT